MLVYLTLPSLKTVPEPPFSDIAIAPEKRPLPRAVDAKPLRNRTWTKLKVVRGGNQGSNESCQFCRLEIKKMFSRKEKVTDLNYDRYKWSDNPYKRPY